MRYPLPCGVARWISMLLTLCAISNHWSVAEEPDDAVPKALQAAPASAPAENPPAILVAESIDPHGHLRLVRYETIFIGFQGEFYNLRSVTGVSLENVEIRTVGGERLSVDEARKRLSEGDTPILATSYGSPLPRFYAPLFTPRTLLFIFPKNSPVWKTIQAPGGPVR